MRQRIPQYRKKGKYSVVTLSDPAGRRRDHYLGEYGTKESLDLYARVIEAWEQSGRKDIRLPELAYEEDRPECLTINGLILKYWKHVEIYYRDFDGHPTGEVENIRHSLKPLRVMFGNTFAKDFGPLALKRVREAMIDGSWMTPEERDARVQAKKPIGLCRKVTNQRVGRIRRMFRWAGENEIISGQVYHQLMTVGGLKFGRSNARETDEVKPIHLQHVQNTLPYLTPTLQDMVMVQYYGGMRPGEVQTMRFVDIDRNGEIWLYRPERHKTAYRGHKRVIPLGPKAQEILRKYLNFQLDKPIFSPARAREEWEAEKRRSRKTKVQPSQTDRTKPNPMRLPGEKYPRHSYVTAIRRAVDKANAAGANVPYWHPHQLRHTMATEIRRTFDLDAARASLGHKSLGITETYAEMDEGLAMKVAAKLG